jgi:sigma-B regulation protein RsbU (phosphoserine phosphatase)
MNKLLQEQIPAGKFVTMGACLYDPKSGVIQWSRAGHPPALVLARASGQVRQLKGEGFPIGFDEAKRFSLEEDRLQPGDALLLFTDGISEAQNRSMSAYGIDRLSNALARTPAEASASEMLRFILDDFNAFRQERLLRDDVTLLLVKRQR